MANEALDQLIRDYARDPNSLEALGRFDAEFRPYVLVLLGSIYSEDLDLVEDAYQSALLKLLERVRTGVKPESAAYFVTMAKYCLIDEIRARRRSVPLDDLVMETFPSASRDISQAEARLVFLEALNGLDRRCQFIIERRFIADLDVAEIARLLNIKPASVYPAIQRCTQRLKEVLEKMGFDSKNAGKM